MIFFGTFLPRQPLAVHYVRLVADDWYSAREVMSLMYPGIWADLYESEAKLPGGLTEVKFGTTNYECVCQ